MSYCNHITLFPQIYFVEHVLLRLKYLLTNEGVFKILINMYLYSIIWKRRSCVCLYVWFWRFSIELKINARGPWATSFAWETSSNQKYILAKLWLHILLTWPSSSGREYFEISWMYFCNFVIIPAVKRGGISIWTNFNLLYPGMLFAKYGQNWPSVSIEEGF